MKLGGNIPVGAEQWAHDEAGDGLKDLDDTTVGGEVSGVEGSHD